MQAAVAEEADRDSAVVAEGERAPAVEARVGAVERTAAGVCGMPVRPQAVEAGGVVVASRVEPAAAADLVLAAGEEPGAARAGAAAGVEERVVPAEAAVRAEPAEEMGVVGVADPAVGVADPVVEVVGPVADLVEGEAVAVEAVV